MEFTAIGSRPGVRRVCAEAQPQCAAYMGGAYRGGLPPTASSSSYYYYFTLGSKVKG